LKLSHFPLGVPLTIAFEEPIKGGLLASPTEFLCLIHQSLLYCILSTQYDYPARPQVDGEHGAVVLSDLMEMGESG
jgi:hypothetical protein